MTLSLLSWHKSDVQHFINLIWQIKNQNNAKLYVLIILFGIVVILIINKFYSSSKISSKSKVKIGNPVLKEQSIFRTSSTIGGMTNNMDETVLETLSVIERIDTPGNFTSRKKQSQKQETVEDGSEIIKEKIGENVSPNVTSKFVSEKLQIKGEITPDLASGKNIPHHKVSTKPTVDKTLIKKQNNTFKQAKSESLEKIPQIIGYTPNNQFKQKEPYQYGVVKMPRAASHVKFARKGRSNRRGHMEASFFKLLKSSFKHDFKVHNDKMIPQTSKRPYEPDFVLINEKENKNIYIVIEIDEPYESQSGTPTHCIGNDDYRDEFLTARGWLVIKFAEIQIYLQPMNCCALIAKVIRSIDPAYKNPLVLKESPIAVKQWDSLTSKKWAADDYRKAYLRIENFGVVPDICADYEILESESDKIVEASVPKSKIKRLKQTGTLATKNKISRDSRLLFDSVSHKYFIDNDPLTTSVTQLVDRFFPEFDKEYWAIIKAAERQITPEAIKEEWEKKRLSAAALGTALHESIEKHYNGKPHGINTTEFQYFLNFKNKFPSLVPFRTEWRVFDEDVMVAGTVDIVYKGKDGKLFIFDWKRSKKVLNPDGSVNANYYKTAIGGLSHLGDTSFNRYCLQQNIYKYILEKKYGHQISSMNLLILHEDYDSAKIIKIPEMKTEVEYIFEYARSMK